MSTLLVTGAGGFVMSHVARQWLDASPANRVVALDAAPFDDSARRFLSDPRLTAATGDVGDAAAWRGLPDAAAITHLVHGAAATSVQRHVAAEGVAGALPGLEANIMGAARALAFADALPALRRFVYVSSGSVYASHGRQAPGQPLPENDGVWPEGWYALSKHSGELLTAEAAAGGLPAVSVRLSGVFGPMDRITATRAVECAPKRLAHAVRDRRRLRLAGLDGGGDWIHASDVAAAILALLACAALRHPVYNIAHGRFTTLRRLAEMTPELSWEESAPDTADVAADPSMTTGRWGAYDISRIQAETGWRPRPLEQAMADYCEWLGDHPA